MFDQIFDLGIGQWDWGVSHNNFILELIQERGAVPFTSASQWQGEIWNLSFIGMLDETVSGTLRFFEMVAY